MDLGVMGTCLTGWRVAAYPRIAAIFIVHLCSRSHNGLLEVQLLKCTYSRLPEWHTCFTRLKFLAISCNLFWFHATTFSILIESRNCSTVASSMENFVESVLSGA